MIELYAVENSLPIEKCTMTSTKQHIGKSNTKRPKKTTLSYNESSNCSSKWSNDNRCSLIYINIDSGEIFGGRLEKIGFSAKI